MGRVGQDFVVKFGMFLFFVALAIHVPNMNNLLLDLSNISDTHRMIFQLAFIVIGFGFLFGVIDKEGRF